MDNSVKRKQHTHQLIKDALLKLLSRMDFIEISVTDICKCAGISRATFYSHYSNTHLIVDELFAEAIENIGNVPVQHIYDPASSGKCDGALCMFLRKNKKYQPLFLSDSLSSQAIRLVVDSLSSRFLDTIKPQSDMSDEMLLNLLYYQISGCMAIIRKHLHSSDEEWDVIRQNVDAFLYEGFRNI